MPMMDGAAHFKDMGLFQDGACPPPSAPSLIRAAITQPPSSLAPPPPPPAPPPPPPPPLLPPPLLPPPLLPPPLLPGPGDPSTGLHRHKSVRKLFWKTIPEHQVKGRPNVWTQGPVEQHQIDAHTIEELFGHNNCQSNSKTPPTRGGRGWTSFRDAKDEVCILDGKRGLNIGIFLKQFKRSNESIVEDIRRGNGKLYGPEPLRELLKLLPESEEVKKLKMFRGDVSKLSLADSFVYLLVQLPSYVVRVEAMLLKEEFPSECESKKHDIRTLRSAIRELMACEELHAVLHLVLQAGNLLNAGGYSGNAVGFKLSSLPTLSETKANKPGMNLLHFVALEAQKKDEKLLEFPLKLPHVQAASRISLEALDSELQSLASRIRSIEENAQRDTDLLQQLHGFLQSASSALVSLRASRLKLRSESEELLDFFCEDKETFRLDDCFSIFSSFCLRFTTAVKDNAERQRKEAARRRRLQQLEEQKRHSWAAGEQFVDAFGLRSSSELDMTSALPRNDEAGLLMEILMPKSRSPLLRRSGSFRRTRNPTEEDVRASEVKHAEKKDSSTSLHVANEQTTQSALNMTTENLRINAKQANADTATSDLNNNGKEQWNDQENSKDELKMDTKLTSSTLNMSVTVEKCTLVPELKVFDKINTPTRSKTQNDVTVLDLDEQNLEKSPEKVDFVVKTKDDVSDTVIVWCVTGVCEVKDVQNDNQNITETDSTNQTASNQQLANQNAVPISSQPMPSTQWGDITTVALQGGKENIEVGCGEVLTNQNTGEKEEGESTNQERAVESDATSGKQESRCDLVKEEVVRQENTKTQQDSKDDQNTRQENEVMNKQKGDGILEKVNSKTSQNNTKVLPNAKTEQLAKKSPSPKGSKAIRTLTTTENHSMRRVVPISRPNSAKAPDRLPGFQRGISSLSVPSRSSSRQGERPSTAPSSRRSSLNKADHDLDLTKKTATKKMQETKKLQQEEKICRSTLRSMNQKEERGVLSAPVTPNHKATPGFARNTASSSFRRTNTSFAKNSVNSNAASSQNSAHWTPKISPKMLSPKLSQKSPSSTQRQNAASVQNDVNSLSKTSKISSPKSPSSTNSIESEAKMNPKVLSQKMSPSSNVAAQKSTINSSDNSNSKITLPSKDQQASETFKSKKIAAEISKTSLDPPSDFANNNTNVDTSKSSEEMDKNVSKLQVDLKNVIQKSQVSANSNQESSKMFSGNESLNLTNNNLDQTSVQATSLQMSPLTKMPNQNGVKTSQLSNLEHLTKQKNPSDAQNSNLSSSGKSLNSRSKISSPKAAPRSSLTSFPSRQSNQNSSSSPKSESSFRVPSSSPKSPDLGLKSVKAPPRSPLLGTPPGGRRRNDSGNFSDRATLSTKDSSRPTWR